MKSFQTIAIITFFLALFLGRPLFGEDKKSYGPTAAHDALQEAFQKATAESKAVFIKSGYPECGWCVIFDRYHHLPEVQQILSKYYVVVAIDTSYMPDGREEFSRFAKPGAPSWVIATAQRKVVIDSFAPKGNVGYPGEPDESSYYLAALKKATPAITEAELQTLAEKIQAAKKRPQ